MSYLSIRGAYAIVTTTDLTENMLSMSREDFKLDHFEIHEVKGFATRDWQIKAKLFEALYSPEIEYIVIT